ncbi:5951_t:CDS:1, partial [Acaulospora morrowiae]
GTVGMTVQKEAFTSEEEITEDGIPSPAIYLTALEEVPTAEKEEEPATKKPEINVDDLTKEERTKVAKLFETKEGLFAEGMNELTQTS